MKNKTELLIGFFLGIISCIIGCFLFIEIFTEYSFFEGIKLLKANGNLGKVMTLGAVLNLGVFWALLQLNKEFMARGVILAVIILAITTIFL